MHIRKILAFICSVSVLLIIFMSQQQLYLVLYSYPEENILHIERVEKGSRFTTFIIHSVNLTPVYETFRIEGHNAFILETARLQDVGFGVPSTFDLAYTVHENFMIIDGFNKTFQELPFRVSIINKPKLFLGDMPQDVHNFEGKIVKLDNFVADGKRITIKILQRNILYDFFNS